MNCQNLAVCSREERDRINVDLAVSGVAYKERMNLPVIVPEVEMQQPEALREYFKALAALQERCAAVPARH